MIAVSRIRPIAALVTAQLVMTAVAGPSFAQSNTDVAATDVAAAEVLFDEGRALMEKGNLAEACPKLAESLRLDTGTGTMLWLAECYQRQGRIASAWAQFRQAASTAEKQKDPRATTARKKALDLEPRLPKLAIVVAPENRIAGLEVTRDGAAVSPATYGTEIPVDPGPHVITARAPGKAPSVQTITAEEGIVAKVEVPSLEAAKTAPAARPALERDEPARVAPTVSGGPWIPLAIGVGAAGLVTVGVGAFFGFRAIDRNNASKAECPGSSCSIEGAALREDAFAAARLSTIFFAAGAATIAGGAAVYLLRPKTGVSLTPTVGKNFTGVMVEGRF